MASRLADQLGDAVHLATPVRRIAQDDDRVRVEGEGTTVVARHAVVTAPPALLLEIDFDPVLPADRLELYRAAVAGPESKTLVVYDEPFWRGEGFSGQSAGPRSAAEVTLDASPATGTPGVLASFAFGEVATKHDQLGAGERRGLLLRELEQRFGPRAAAPVEVIETPWWHEEWTRGCSMAHLPPGVLSRLGPLLRAPLGRVHWAGTETSTTSHGAIDGAIRSGERAAAEVLDR
jgi:monoamine oxidase